MNISRMKKFEQLSPPSRSPNQALGGAGTHPSEVEDSYEGSRELSPGLKVGAAFMAALSFLGAAGCTPTTPVHAPPVEQTAQTHVESAKEVDLAKATETPAKTLQEKELELRERELALREKEFQLMQKRESQDARLRKLQTQRESYEKGKRIGEGVGVAVDIFSALGKAASDSLR